MEESEGPVSEPGEALERTSLGPGRLGALRDRVRQSLALRITLTVVALALLLVALLPAYLFYSRPHPALAAAKMGNITLTVKAQGSVEALIYSASFATPGVVTQVNVVPGQRVRAGETLATLDTTVAQAAVSDAQTALSDAQSAASAASTALTDAQTAQTSAQTSLSTQQSYMNTACSLSPPDAKACDAATAAEARAQAQADAAQAQLDDAQAQVDAAQVTLDNTQGALTAAQAELASTSLVAPHDGVALTVNGRVGDEVGLSGLPFITVADTADPEAMTLVSYHDITSVEPGENVTLKVAQASGSPSLRGTVEGVTLIPQGSGDHLDYPVTITIDPASLNGASLLPGMSASVTIITRQVTNIVTLPVSAVTYARHGAPASGKGLLTAAQIKDALQAANTLEAQVIADGLDAQHDPPTASYLIGFAHGKYVAIPVVLGLSDGQRQEIIAGLDAGQQIVSAQRNPFQG